MPIATIIAMKPSLQHGPSRRRGACCRAVVGAALAALVLLVVDNRTALEVAVVLLVALAMSIHTVNYAWYTAAMAGAILIAADAPHPSDLTDEGRRILFTFAGVAIAVIVMFLADRLAKAHAKTYPSTCRPGPCGLSGPGRPRPDARHAASATIRSSCRSTCPVLLVVAFLSFPAPARRRHLRRDSAGSTVVKHLDGGGGSLRIRADEPS